LPPWPQAGGAQRGLGAEGNTAAVAVPEGRRFPPWPQAGGAQRGQTLVIVTHDSRIAATADRLISMRDGTFIDETRLTGGTHGSDLGALAGLDG
jgi:hypothetical protein